MAKREEPEEHNNSERWMLTYLDMITLLMVFFVLMYSMSSLDAQKFNALAAQLGIDMGGGNSVLSNQTIDPSMNQQSDPAAVLPQASDSSGDAISTEMSLVQVEKEIKELIKQENLGEFVSENLDERGVVISMREAMLFELGSADINQHASDVLGKITNIIGNTKNFIRVEGSTDDLPIHTAVYASNWELASQRAVNVVAIMINNGLDPSRVSAMSYGEYRPIVPNTSEENRKRNRRVDIVIINQQYSGSEPKINTQN